MAQYYGVVRSSEYLAHYGIKGMKWGVRKAIERGDNDAYNRAYKKAFKKLVKLSINANQRVQKERFSNAKRNMLAGAGVGGTISGLGTFALNPYMDIKDRALLSGGAALAGALSSAALNSEGIMSGRYASDKGHNKAIKKRDEWRKEMESTFKTTKSGDAALRKFHGEVTNLSNVDNPAKYVRKISKAPLNSYYKKRKRG